MEKEPKVDDPSGTIDPSSAGSTNSGPSGDADKTVSYSAYKKSLTQEKNLRARVQEYEEKLRAIEEEKAKKEAEELAKQGEFKKLLELEKAKREELEASNNEYKKSILDAHKLNAFKEKLKGKVANPAYYDFVDIESIVMNPETGEIEETSVQNVVDRFVTEHSALIKTDRPRLPDNAPKDGGGSNLDYESWKKLPLIERKKRMAEVMAKERKE